MSTDGPKYLTTRIVESRRTAQPSWGMTREGYTYRTGAPSSLLVRLEGEKIWRRLMVIQISNAGSCFLRIRGERFFVPDYMLPGEQAAA